MTNFRLFHMAIPGRIHARTFRCIWLLEELDVKPFEVCMVTPGQPYAPQMRKYGVQESTKLPTLVMDGREIGESGLICHLLAKRFRKTKDLRGTESEKIDLLQWMSFAETCIMLRVPLMPLLLDSEKTIDALRSEVIQPQRDILSGNIDRFESHFRIKEKPYLLASGFSLADIMCGWSLYTFHNWGLIELTPEESPLTLEYLERLKARPAFIQTEQYAELRPGLHVRD